MKYLITGGGGFIGIKLVERLIKNKANKIYIIDNFSKKKNKKNLSKILKNKKVKKIKNKIKKKNFNYKPKTYY